MTFIISGALHSLAECYGGGLQAKASGTMRYFVTQAIGIFIEDMAQDLWRLAFGYSKGTVWSRVIGYIWVLSFQVWSTPAWLYPQAMRGPQQSVLPFTVIGAFKN